ncbi:MAG: NAD(P)-binding domain-containing protein [Collimonas pratensis]|uniref:NADPH-dependent F420 reductase n=1 Tax=Collimonas pratensis TaxID=279113 RepID=UPI003C72CF62
MKIGFIGAGSVAQKYAKYFVRHGHEVVLSNSRGPDSLNELVSSIGSNARAATVQEAAMQDIVILCVRWEQAKQALAEISDWGGRILVDATNRPASEDAEGKTSSEIIASYAPGAGVIKALNTLVMNWMPDSSENDRKLVLFMSGDDKAAKQKLARVLDEAGFAPVDLGGLIESGRLQEFGAPLSGLHMNLVKRMNS